MSFCSSCGNEIKVEHNFCQKCGYKSTHQIKQGGSENKNNTEDKFDKRKTNFTGKASKPILIFLLVAILIGVGALALKQGKLKNTSTSADKNNTKSFNANSSNAVDITNWLVMKGYCFNVNENLNPSNYEKEFVEQSLISDCNDDGRRNVMRKNLVSSKFYGIRFYVYTGLAKSDQISVSKKLNYISADNWLIEVTTNETAFPGSYKDAQQLMKVIVEELGGSLNSGYKPGDECTVTAYLIESYSNTPDENIISPEDKVFLSECKKYFPEAIGDDLYL
jgi:hypothetical protein